MIKEYTTVRGLVNIDLSKVVSCRQSKDNKTDQATLWVRMSNGDDENLTDITEEEFVSNWRLGSMIKD